MSDPAVPRPPSETSPGRRRRRRLRRPRGDSRRAVMMLPSLVTTGALGLGFWSTTQSIHGRFNAAAWAIMFAAILDTMDGRIARATQSTTRFGVEYDSLADVICYGVAPALFLYCWLFDPLLGSRAWAPAALFPICAALRLARFNVQADVPRDHYIGIPSTAAGGIVAMTYWFADSLEFAPRDMRVWSALLSVFFIGVALLMVSTLPYPNWRSIPVMRRHAFPSLLAAVGTLLLVLVNLEPALFLLAMLYLLSGPFLHWRRSWAQAQGPLGGEAPVGADPILDTERRNP